MKILLPFSALIAGAGGGCHKGTELEAGAVLLDLSVTSGVTTPDELRVFVYDDTGTLWDTRVPQSGALMPQSPTHLGTVLLQPGATQGGMRIHVQGLAASVRVADGTMTIPPPPRGQFALVLDGAVPADGDGDGVPDAIDDCPAVANPNQGGCPGTNDGGADTAPDDGGSDTAPDDGGQDALGCDASGACDRAIGAQCTDGAQCHSTFCVDGVCCANACVGPCRSCNQPNNDGMCLPYPQGMDPAAECTGGMTCNGVGSCGPAPGGPKVNGELCSAGSECSSTFCKDGVCCNSACDTPCHSCATGTCNAVTRMPDPPECYGTKTCNAAGKCG
ncbi:MAG TPA: hypothetical protein VKQ32_21875 [Polyangia bacterium]|nr:hypothetical protein [Polyangia bacterium]